MRSKLLLSVFLLAVQSVLGQEPMVATQEINERILGLASAVEVHAGDYLIGSADLLRIDVFDVPDLSREVRVSESGHISLPLIPVKIRAGGLTAFQLEEKLVELLQVNGLVSYPQVTIFVKEHHSQPITVIGAVNRASTLQAIRHTTLLEALSEADGLADDAGGVVIVTRPASLNTLSGASTGRNENGPAIGPQTITIGLKELLESGNPQYNIPILAVT